MSHRHAKLSPRKPPQLIARKRNFLATRSVKIHSCETENCTARSDIIAINLSQVKQNDDDDLFNLTCLPKKNSLAANEISQKINHEISDVRFEVWQLIVGHVWTIADLTSCLEKMFSTKWRGERILGRYEGDWESRRSTQKARNFAPQIVFEL